MSSYVQIGDDPTKWWLEPPIKASQLTGQPLSVNVSVPVVGTLVLSGKAASVAVFEESSDPAPKDLDVPIPTIYVPTPAGISEGHVGYELPASANQGSLANDIAAAMRDGHSQTVALGGSSSGGTLVLNGATLSFVVLCWQNPPAVGGATPHG
jgi:hypothetical protein